MDNLRAALAWALDARPAWALGTAADLGHFWEVRGHLLEGHAWLERGLASAPRAPGLTRTRALLLAGWFSFLRGDGELAHERLAAGLTPTPIGPVGRSAPLAPGVSLPPSALNRKKSVAGADS